MHGTATGRGAACCVRPASAAPVHFNGHRPRLGCGNLPLDGLDERVRVVRVVSAKRVDGRHSQVALQRVEDVEELGAVGRHGRLEVRVHVRRRVRRQQIAEAQVPLALGEAVSLARLAQIHAREVRRRVQARAGACRRVTRRDATRRAAPRAARCKSACREALANDAPCTTALCFACSARPAGRLLGEGVMGSRESVPVRPNDVHVSFQMSPQLLEMLVSKSGRERTDQKSGAQHHKPRAETVGDGADGATTIPQARVRTTHQRSPCLALPCLGFVLTHEHTPV